jgi:hypothetical protein
VTAERSLDAAFRENAAATLELIWRARAQHGETTEISETFLGLEENADDLLEKGCFFSRRNGQSFA